MKKVIFWIGAIIIVLVGGFYALNSYIYEQKQASAAKDYKDAEYFIDGQRIQLKNGVSEIESAPGSASKVITRYFGNEVRQDLDLDGREDVAFLLTQETGGSGVFYYVVAALNTEKGYVGSAGLFLGDRIAPQTTEVSKNPSHKGVIVVNYADRKPGESMATKPSMGKSILLKLDPQSMQFGEVAQNFEGEADPSKMTLIQKSWIWMSALYNDGTEITPKNPGKFTVTFGKDGAFSASTDCNRIGGKYTVNENQITFGDMFSTKMYCEGSQEDVFSTLLTNSMSYRFTSKGELILDLKFDSGSVVFK